jgi:hypothetical protein
LGKSQRTKGAVGEREVAALFSAHTGREYKRNIGQARDGGNDIDIEDLVVEVKRRKTLGTIYGWLQQAIAAATQPLPASVINMQPILRGTPVVVARQDGGEWVVVLRLRDFLPIWGAWLNRDTLPASG